MEEKDRPKFLSLYFDEPDHTGHYEGPGNVNEITNILSIVNHSVSMLIDGLKARDLLGCINIIIGADHGMAPNNENRRSFMNDFGGEKDVKYCSNYKESGVYCYSGAVGRIGPALNSGGKFDVDNEWPKFKESRQKG